MASFFKKPTWAQASTPAKPQDFFRRSNQVYSDFVATTQDEDETDDEAATAKETPCAPNEPKRRRISNEDEDETTSTLQPRIKSPPQEIASGSDTLTRDTPPKLEEAGTSKTPPRSPRSARSSPRKPGSQRSSPRKSQLIGASPPGTIIRLNSESPPPPASRVPPKSVIQIDSDLDNDGDNDEESDEDCAALIKRARERARNNQVREENKPASPNGKDNTTRKTTGTPSASPKAASNPSPKKKDTVVNILITSNIQNTKSLLVRRLLSQNLGEVRKAWCNHQKYDEETSDNIILTWKGRRLFDVTTCKSLGINDTDTNDNSVFDSSPFDMEEGNAGVHMEAMTEEMLEERRRAAATAQQDNSEEESEDEQPKAREPADTDLVRITLKNPDLDDFRIKVRPSTQIGNILKKFRQVKEIPEHISVSLYFDGDKLDPDTLIEDNDIDDMDCIDVIMK
ncbi:TPA_exp: Uncharacterized protein A8136_1938 [Trichophyton benhamiae CBS 112371]|uniref:Ubiquitin-like domain-containing protein n=1 Tax=Arthroderma benhamiae (strain ATCC MYA-4681 / CBS 112371) TaxID=663331 RepID=D4AXQ1_ARTBC|nr:uncharacterized protein ARB_00970 [Trichophyton benhamiae CBS 112371]EFE32079.1 conserved hypothetical protein [Trichophyton benhamiae CBS 112371]DAA75187.1 TPA_exp: Uncharacterized protein A8136_1938 [Trichophyton benhamiae CBS 112371]